MSILFFISYQCAVGTSNRTLIILRIYYLRISTFPTEVSNKSRTKALSSSGLHSSRTQHSCGLTVLWREYLKTNIPIPACYWITTRFLVQYASILVNATRVGGLLTGAVAWTPLCCCPVKAEASQGAISPSEGPSCVQLI